jgi:LEA14-like dessication related protein
MRRLKTVLTVVAVLVAVVVIGWLIGIFGLPTVGIVDVGDWGTVSEERTEIQTEMWVNNPNPIGVAVGSSLRFDYGVRMNGVKVADGDREGIAIQQGNQTKTITTNLRNDRLPAWWVEYVRANETIHTRIDATTTVAAGLRASTTVTRNRTIMKDSAPMIAAFSKTAASVEGEYPRSGPTTLYEIRRGWATWGPVNDTRTVVRFHFLVHNPSTVPVPARPDGLRTTIRMNDVRMLQTTGDEFSAGDLGPDTVLRPGETREIVLSVAMDNEKIDDWFTSHVRRNERTDVAVDLQLVYEDPRTGTEIVLPPGGISYNCRLQTAILVDDRNTSTTCDPPTR